MILICMYVRWSYPKEELVDKDSRRFGFRWFEASGIGEDAVFRLNGKRIMLRSAISWSFLAGQWYFSIGRIG
mgnify:CR=1 FL=1